MSYKFDKQLILNRIRDFYKFSSEQDFATFLGIKPSTLSNWSARDSVKYETLFTKCKELNTDWILYGIGNPTKGYPDLEDTKSSSVFDPTAKEVSLLEEIERLKKVVSLQDETISAQAKTIEVMNKLIGD